MTGYVLPWLVFHFWLSTLSLLQHTAPHIPFRAEGEGYDYGRAVVCGTVTVRLPRPLEVLLNDANYSLPQLVAPGLPVFRVREAYDYMRERLLPYLTEATLSMRLLTNHITRWQVGGAVGRENVVGKARSPRHARAVIVPRYLKCMKEVHLRERGRAHQEERGTRGRRN